MMWHRATRAPGLSRGRAFCFRHMRPGAPPRLPNGRNSSSSIIGARPCPSAPGATRAIVPSPGNLDPNAARGALGQTFLRALAASFRRDGAKRMRELSEQRPHDYLKLAAALLPKEYRLKAVDLSDMGDAELTRALAMVREAIRQKEQEGGGGPARPQPEG